MTSASRNARGHALRARRKFSNLHTALLNQAIAAANAGIDARNLKRLSADFPLLAMLYIVADEALQSRSAKSTANGFVFHGRRYRVWQVGASTVKVSTWTTRIPLIEGPLGDA